MSDNARTWTLIHSERKALAAALAGLTPEQWEAQSLCAAWTIKDLAAHVLSGAEQTPGRFMRGMAVTGLRFNALMERDARNFARLSPEQIVDRLGQRTSTTNHPPAPVMAMLGEVVVHGEDIRRPLGLTAMVADDAANACLQMYTKASFPVGGRKRIGGLRLAATDTGWSYGTGAEVSGPAMSLLLAMTGRAAGIDGLTGDGVATLSERIQPGPASRPAR
jgi:uncharacterized protein (TIGR03083 family)